MYEEIYERKRDLFLSLGDRGRYTEKQKRLAFELITEYGMRATARILKIPRRTLQRWCRQYGIYVKRCPSWIYGWAERRRKRREFWQRRGYY
jgi:transposase-like protein